MIVVRYATLVALVIWMDAMAGAQFGDLLRRTPFIPYACGAAVVIGLFVLKFMGPPPRGFVLRLGITILMLAIALAAAFVAPREAAHLLTAVDLALGFVLLIWYVRE
jgi:hypothetical protein